jgi:azurin
MMYQAARVLIAFVVASVAIACAGPNEASPSASEAARATATAEEPTPTPDPIAAILEQCADAPEPEGETVALTLGASTEGFDTDRLEGPRHCEPFTITLTSTGSSAEHMVAIEPLDQIGVLLFDGELIGRDETTTYDIPPLPAGEYRFLCSPHRSFMQGTLVVAPSA